MKAGCGRRARGRLGTETVRGRVPFANVTGLGSSSNKRREGLARPLRPLPEANLDVTPASLSQGHAETGHAVARLPEFHTRATETLRAPAQHAAVRPSEPPSSRTSHPSHRPGAGDSQPSRRSPSTEPLSQQALPGRLLPDCSGAGGRRRCLEVRGDDPWQLLLTLSAPHRDGSSVPASARAPEVTRGGHTGRSLRLTPWYPLLKNTSRPREAAAPNRLGSERVPAPPTKHGEASGPAPPGLSFLTRPGTSGRHCEARPGHRAWHTNPLM